MRIRKYLPEFVYGATDGAITTFAIIAVTVGATLSHGIIIILGFSNVFSDGFAMASSDYLSIKSGKYLGENNGKDPFKSAVITFFSFILVGSIPVIPFVITIFVPSFESIEAIVSLIVTSLAFLIIGYIKGVVTNKPALRSAIETLLIGSFAAFIAFFVGKILGGIV